MILDFQCCSLARTSKNEGLSSAQLLLFLNDLAERKAANDEGDANSNARVDANDKASHCLGHRRGRDRRIRDGAAAATSRA
jgi:hypothetical protein